MTTTSARAAVPALYLAGVEGSTTPSIYRTLIDDAKARGAEYSKIWDLFAYEPDFTIYMARFTQGVLRKPAPITPATRDLIAAYTSYLNDCPFCTNAHAAAASELIGDEALVWKALRDLESSPLPEKDKALLRFVGKVTKNLPAVQRGDVAALQASGWDDEAIYYAITTCALFNFYNRWITATGVPEMSEAAHRVQGQRLAAHGYVRE